MMPIIANPRNAMAEENFTADLLLIDGHNLAFRAFYGIRDLRRDDGFSTNALFGWVKTLWRLLDRIQPSQRAVFFDLGHSAARREILAEYKAQRKPMPDSLCQQLPLIKKISPLLGFQVIERQSVEADDLLACTARWESQQRSVAIASADKDFAQIIGNDICQWCPPANGKDWQPFNATAIERKFGVKPVQIVDYLSLIGDSADNIAGIPGVGPKTASRWLREFGSIDNLLRNPLRLTGRFSGGLAPFEPLLRRNQRLIHFDLSLPMEPLQSFPPDENALALFLEEFQMTSLQRELEKRAAGKKFPPIKTEIRPQMELF